MAEPCFVCKRMACCLCHLLVLSRLIPRPLVILIMSLLPSLYHLFSSLVSPFIIPLCLLSCVGSLCVSRVFLFVSVSLCECLLMNTLSLKNVLILFLLLVNRLVKCFLV